MAKNTVSGKIVPTEGQIWLFNEKGSPANICYPRTVENAVVAQNGDNIRRPDWTALEAATEGELRFPYIGNDATKPTTLGQYRGYPHPFLNTQPYRTKDAGSSGTQIAGTMSTVVGAGDFRYMSVTLNFDQEFPVPYDNDIKCLLWRSTNINYNLGSPVPMVSSPDPTSFPAQPIRTIFAGQSGTQKNLGFIFPCTGTIDVEYWWHLEFIDSTTTPNDSWYTQPSNKDNTSTSLVFQTQITGKPLGVWDDANA